MKLLLSLELMLGAYYYFLTQTTNVVLGQVQHIQSTYGYAADQADEIAVGSYR